MVKTVVQLLLVTALCLAAAGCAAQPGPQQAEPAEPSPVVTQLPASTPEPTAAAPTFTALPGSASTKQAAPQPAATLAPSPTIPPAAPPTPTFDPAAWTDLPVIPTLSPRAIEIIQNGLAKGNDAHVFSKVGDCESQASWFLEIFDQGEQHYALGSYEAELNPVIAYYSGSFARPSLAAKQGFTAASLRAPIWANREVCEKNEGALACEYRLNRPIVALVTLGTNDANNPKTFEEHMRKVIEYSIEQGVLPVLGTKADNVEKDHYINATIAKLGMEYQVPVWNFWAAVQELPHKGLQHDGIHLTYASTRFDKTSNMKKAWPVRNLNALQILKLVMEQTNQ